MINFVSANNEILGAKKQEQVMKNIAAFVKSCNNRIPN